MEGLMEAACEPEAQIVVTAVVGMIGIRPTIAAMEAGKDIALANKETLVTAGHIIMPLAKEKGVKILPVDSEHSAIFQCLQGSGREPDPQDSSDGFRRPIQRPLQRTAGRCTAGGCLKASQLVHGAQDYH